MSVYDVHEARERYFKSHPFDPNKNVAISHDIDGLPAGFLTLPDMGEMQVVAMKFGYEFLATCSTDDDVDKWLSELMKTAQSQELIGIMLGHVLRGIAPIASMIIDSDPGRRFAMLQIAADGWEKEF